MATTLEIIAPVQGIRTGGNPAGLTVPRLTSYVVHTKVIDGDPTNVIWSTEGYEDCDEVILGSWVCSSECACARVLKKDNPESPHYDPIYDESFASYGEECTEPYDYQPNYIITGNITRPLVPCTEKGPTADQSAASSFVSPSGKVWTKIACSPILTKGEPLRVCLTHYNRDAQDVATGARVGKGSHLGLTGHLDFHVYGDSDIVVVGLDGRKAVVVASGGRYYLPPNKRGEFAKVGTEYVETAPEGTRHVYDAYGNEIRRSELNGNAVYFNYDYGYEDSGRRGRMINVTGDLALVPYFHYDANGRMTCLQVKDPTGGLEDRASYFEYDAGGRVVVFQGPEGCRTQFAYDTYGQITSETDPEGYTTYFEYTPDYYGQIRKMVQPEGKSAYFDHDLGSGILTKVDARGYPTYYHYNHMEDNDGVVDALGYEPQYGHDLYGSVTAEKNARGYATYYEYSGYDRTKAKDALGNETQYAYGAYGRVTYVRDALNRETYYVYDSVGNRTSTKDPLGSISYSQYAAGGLRTGEIDQLGRATYFGYDSWGNQVVWQDALKHDTYYVYDGAGNQTRVIDARANATYFEYDKRDRQTKLKDALLYSRQFGYDGRGLKTVEIDELGFAGYWQYDGLQRLSCSKDFGLNPTYYAYDLVGNLVRQADPTCVTTYYHYDELNRQKCVGDGLGAKTYFEYDAVGNQVKVIDPLERVSQTFYDELDRAKCSQDALGNQTYFDYDAVGNQIKVVDPLKRVSVTYFDALNRPRCVSDTLGHKSYYDYDEVGNRVRVYEPRNFPTYYAYDELNRLAIQWTPRYDYGEQAYGETPYGGVEETAAYYGYDEVGNRVRVQDSRLNTTYFHFDKLNRLDWQKDAAGYYTYYEYTARSEQAKVKSPRLAEQQSVYDAAGRVTKQIDPLNVTTYFYYDEAGRRTRTHLAALDQVTYLEYDKVGRQTHVKTTPDGSAIYDTETVYDVAGQAVRTVNPRGYATYFQYDLVGRQQKVKDALLNETYFGYDAVGNRILTILPRSYASYFGFDAANRLTQVVDPENVAGYFAYDANGNRTQATVGAGAEARTTYFEFDNLNRMASVTTPDGGVTVFKCDKNGNRSSENNPLGHTTYYGYNERNELVRVQDALGETAYYEHDSVGNLTKAAHPSGATAYFEHDLKNQWTAVRYSDGFAAYYAFDAAGNMTRSQWAAGTTYYEVDRMNRQTKKIDPLAGTFEYVRDENGNVMRLVYPGGSGMAYYAFDELDRVSRIKSPAGNGTYYSYDQLGNRSRILFGNGTHVYFEYDKAERTSQVLHCLADGSPLAYFDYARNSTGDIIRAVREDGAVVYYGYDAAGRLVSEAWKDSGGSTLYGFEWQYDLAGNRVWQNALGVETDFFYNAANAINKKSSAGAWTYYDYDPDGNLETLTEPVRTTKFSHAAHGLVNHIESSGEYAYFGYDGELQRRWMRTVDGCTYFDWDSALRLLGIRTPSETIVITHGASPVDGIGTVVEEQHIGGETLVHHVGPNGTTHAITRKSDNGAAAFWKGQSNAFGEELAKTGNLPSIFWFQGEAWYRVVINGRTYYVSPTRIYDLIDSRFLERDLTGRVVGRLRFEQGTLLHLWGEAPFFGAGDYKYLDTYSALLNVDPYGLWKVFPNNTHLDLITQSVEGAWPMIRGTDPCKKYVIKQLDNASFHMDFGAYGAEDGNHYVRAPEASSQKPNANVPAAEARYKLLIQRRLSWLNDVVFVSGPSQVMCEHGLKFLGQLSHSWQDYYAHAILLSGAPGPAWSANPQIKGSPDRLNPQLKPSSFSSGFGDEHGVTEPGSRDSAITGWVAVLVVHPESGTVATSWEPIIREGEPMRLAEAVVFVAKKYGSLLKKWHSMCKCYCPPS